MPLLWKPVVRGEDRRRGTHTERLIVKYTIPNWDMLKTGSVQDKVGLYNNQPIGHLSYCIVVSNLSNLQKVNPGDSATLLEHLSLSLSPGSAGSPVPRCWTRTPLPHHLPPPLIFSYCLMQGLQPISSCQSIFLSPWWWCPLLLTSFVLYIITSMNLIH